MSCRPPVLPETLALQKHMQTTTRPSGGGGGFSGGGGGKARRGRKRRFRWSAEEVVGRGPVGVMMAGSVCFVGFCVCFAAFVAACTLAFASQHVGNHVFAHTGARTSHPLLPVALAPVTVHLACILRGILGAVAYNATVVFVVVVVVVVAVVVAPADPALWAKGSSTTMPLCMHWTMQVLTLLLLLFHRTHHLMSATIMSQMLVCSGKTSLIKKMLRTASATSLVTRPSYLIRCLSTQNQNSILLLRLGCPYGTSCSCTCKHGWR